MHRELSPLRTFGLATTLLFVALGFPNTASAGMPRSVAVLDRLVTARLDAISFFALGYLGCAWIVQRVWNGLQLDFPRLPRLDYRRALGLTTLWAVLAMLVLTMISGARELLTPGAWQPDGVGYRLTQPVSSAEKSP